MIGVQFGMETVRSDPPGAAADKMAWITTTTLGLIAIGIVVVIVMIWWGMTLSRRRKAAARELAEDQGTRAEAPGTLDEGDVQPAPAADQPSARAPDPAPAPTPPARPVDAADDRVTPAPMPAPVAPSLPPLADAETVAAPPRAPEPAAGDDLTRMKGAGPKVAARFAELGITRFDQLAALTPAESEALDAQLGAFKGRLARDRWIEQAGYLARGDVAGFEAAFGKL